MDNKKTKKGIVNEPDPPYKSGKRPTPPDEKIGFPGNDTPKPGDIFGSDELTKGFLKKSMSDEELKAARERAREFFPDVKCERCGSDDLYSVGEFLICGKCGATIKTE